MRSNIHVNKLRGLAKYTDRCKIIKCELVLGTEDRVNITCLMHDTCICQIPGTEHKR